jgi:predicted nucleotidyltransferase component of viral defense system
MRPKLAFLPPQTRALFQRLAGEPLMAGLILVGGSALALQIGHRSSEDLDFALLGPKLPSARLNGLIATLEAEGRTVSLMTVQSDIERFRINTGRKLLDYARDYAVDRAKLTFFARGVNAPKAQVDFLARSAHSHAKISFQIMGLDGLFAMKALVLAERARSRDLFDLMVLIRDRGYRIEDAFRQVQTLAPIEQRDIERHKAVMTGVIPLDREDEGFESLGLKTGVSEIYKFFDAEIGRFERDVAREVLREAGREDGDGN